jgi:type IV pilus assembly protein PilC
MAAFEYTARDSGGKIINGSIDAETQELVLSRLRQMGYFVINIKKLKDESEGLKNKKIEISFLNRIKIRDVVIFTRQFSTLISSGMSLLESLNILQRQTSNTKLAKIISEIKIDVESGHTLSESMEKHPAVFNRLYVSLVRAGEAGGVLDKTMNDLAIFLERDEAIRHSVSSKTAYPKFILVFAIIITFAMILFIVPTFQDIYADLGADLPGITKGVIAAGNVLKKPYFYVILITVVFGGRYLIRRILKSEKGRHAFDTIKLKIPKMGDVFLKLSIAKFTRHFGVLLATGVPILKALDITKGIADNVLIDEALEEIKLSIREGENISEPMSRNPLFPNMMVQMLAVGERTGTLDSMSNKVADFYDDESATSIDSLVTMLEPMMLLLVAALVGIIVVSMYLPMFNIYQAMQ